MKSVLVLTFLCVVSALCLALIHHGTKEVRQNNRESYENRQLSDLIEPQSNTNLCDKGFELYRTTVRGYGGEIVLAIVYHDQVMKGVRVLSHQETPGFADVLNPSDWISNFGRRPIARIDAVSRATITSSAVLRAVSQVETMHDSGEGPCG